MKIEGEDIPLYPRKVILMEDEMSDKEMLLEIDFPEDMNIGGALYFMNEGHKVRRAGWNNSVAFLKLQVPEENSKMTLPYIYIEYPVGSFAYPEGSKVPWLASQTDLLADDWYVVVDEETPIPELKEPEPEPELLTGIWLGVDVKLNIIQVGSGLVGFDANTGKDPLTGTINGDIVKLQWENGVVFNGIVVNINQINGTLAGDRWNINWPLIREGYSPVPPTPSPTLPPSGPDIISRLDLNNGTLGDFLTQGGQHTGNQNISIVNGPAFIINKRVVALNYRRSSLSQSADINVAFQRDLRSIGRSVGPGGYIRFTGKFYLPRPGLGSEGMLRGGRKLLYFQRPGNNGVGIIVSETWDNQLSFACPHDDLSRSRAHYSAHNVVPYDQWHDLFVELYMNVDRTKSDGTALIKLNGSTIFAFSNINYFHHLSDFVMFKIGQQSQGFVQGRNANTLLFDEFRYWTDIELVTR